MCGLGLKPLHSTPKTDENPAEADFVAHISVVRGTADYFEAKPDSPGFANSERRGSLTAASLFVAIPAEVAMTKNANNLGCCKVLRESNSSNFSQLLAVGIFVSFPTHCEVNDC